MIGYQIVRRPYFPKTVLRLHLIVGICPAPPVELALKKVIMCSLSKIDKDCLKIIACSLKELLQTCLGAATVNANPSIPVTNAFKSRPISVSFLIQENIRVKVRSRADQAVHAKAEG